MKIKKILSLLLCVALCIVPLPFKMNAMEDDCAIISQSASPANAVCDCGVNYVLVNYSPTFTIVAKYATANSCCRVRYDAVRGQCPVCKQLATFYDIYETRTTHKIVSFIENGTIVQECEYCYYRYVEGVR